MSLSSRGHAPIWWRARARLLASREDGGLVTAWGRMDRPGLGGSGAGGGGGTSTSADATTPTRAGPDERREGPKVESHATQTGSAWAER